VLACESGYVFGVCGEGGWWARERGEEWGKRVRRERGGGKREGGGGGEGREEGNRGGGGQVGERGKRMVMKGDYCNTPSLKR